MSVFKGCVICFTGSLSLGTRKETTALVEEQGATVSTSVTKSTTHLVTNQETVASQTTSVTKAQDNEIFIVSEQWVTDSIKAKKKKDESEYTLVDDEEDDDDDDKKKKKAAPAKKTAPATTSTSRKRSAPTKDEDEDDSEDEATEEPPKKKGKTVKVVTKGKYAVAPESGYANDSNAHIYVNGEDAYTAMLNQTNISGNNNKFYQIQLIERGSGRFTLFQRWGRVGASGTVKNEVFNSADKGMKAFEKKFKDKTRNDWSDRHDFVPHRNKYTMIEVSYESDDEDDENGNVFSKSGSEKRKKAEAIPSKLDPRVQDVIKLISNIDTMKDTMKEFEIDIERMPLGKLSKKQIMKGYEILKMIQRKLGGKSRNDDDDDEDDDDENEDGFSSRDSLERLSSRFYTLIPHSFGMRVPPIIDAAAKLQKKIEMLQTLSDMEIAQTLLQSTEKMSDINPIDSAYDSLKTDLVPLDKNGEEFKVIQEYVKNTHAATHNNYTLDLQDVFAVKRAGEEERFMGKCMDLHNKRLLWHGSRITNYMGILSQGLRIAPPEAPVTGYMFGKGVYFADMVSKSANYCFAHNSNNTGFMLLSEVALGDMYERLNADGTLPQTLPAKYKSTWGKGLTVPDPSMSKTLNGVEVPVGIPTKSDVRGAVLQYNEFIVYDVAQVNIKYMLKLKFNYRR